MFERHQLRRCIGKRIVARIDNVTWHGTLAAYSCEWLELKNASVVDNITGETSADGLILLPEERIDFIQITEAD